VRARWLVLVMVPIGCMDPVGPSVPDTPSARTDLSLVLQESERTVTTLVDGYRYVTHYDARPVPCVAGSRSMFPVRALADRDAWYGSQLRAGGEGPLCAEASPTDEVYRLAWIPSFHHTVIVRVEKRGSDYSFSAAQLSGAGGYEPGTLGDKVSESLSESEWNVWLELLSQSRFWRAHTIADDTVFDASGKRTELVGLDGAEWLLEAVRGGEYHAVDRWSPLANGPDAAFRRACSWLLHRSGFAPDTLVSEY
jgi:hypothetical protein